MRTNLLLGFSIGLLIASSSWSRAEDIRAKTSDGKEVILKSDGTWSYVEKEKEEKKSDVEFKKDEQSEVAYKGKHGTFTMNLTPKTWKKSEKTDHESAEVMFRHKDGDALSMIIAERTEMSTDKLVKIALKNMKAIDPDAKVILQEKRKVNGVEMTCMTVQAKVDDVAFIYHSYYYSGEEGSFQVLTWCGRNLFKDLKPDMEAFLNGFEIVKKKD